MSLRVKKGCVALLILRVHTPQQPAQLRVSWSRLAATNLVNISSTNHTLPVIRDQIQASRPCYLSAVLSTCC